MAEIRWLDGITDSRDMSLSKLWERQGSLACCSPWGCKVLDTNEQQYNNLGLEIRETASQVILR